MSHWLIQPGHFKLPKRLKEEVAERFNKLAEELGEPDLLSKVADETVGLTEDEIQAHLEKVGHPAVSMDPMM